MIEISENLHRAELTALERGRLVKQWKRLVGEDKPAQVAQVSGGRGNKGGESEAARQLNLSRRDVERSVKIASLSPEAQAVAVETTIPWSTGAFLRPLPSLKVRFKNAPCRHCA